MASSATSILVIDDSDITFQMVQDVLEDYSVVVYQAKDGFDGFLKIGNIRPDIVILDINMPGMTGDDVLSRIRTDDSRNNFHTVVMVVTGDPMRETVTKIAKLGVDGYLIKPFAPEKLMEMLKKLSPLSRKDPNRSIG